MPRNLSAWVDACVHLAVLLVLVLVISYYNHYVAVISLVIWICMVSFSRERCMDRQKAFDDYCRNVIRNVNEVMNIIGDIEGRNCIVMDDMIDTAGTLVKAAEVLKQRGAKKVYAYRTHPVFSGPAIDRISNGTALDGVVVTNTIPLSQAARDCKKIRQLSVAPLIAETINRIATGDSVMSLFSEEHKLI